MGGQQEDLFVVGLGCAEGFVFERERLDVLGKGVDGRAEGLKSPARSLRLVACPEGRLAGYWTAAHEARRLVRPKRCGTEARTALCHVSEWWRRREHVKQVAGLGTWPWRRARWAVADRQASNRSRADSMCRKYR